MPPAKSSKLGASLICTRVFTTSSGVVSAATAPPATAPEKKCTHNVSRESKTLFCCWWFWFFRFQFQFGAIESILIAGNVGKLFIGDHLVGDGIKVDLNQGHPNRNHPLAILATLESKR